MFLVRFFTKRFPSTPQTLTRRGILHVILILEPASSSELFRQIANSRTKRVRLATLFPPERNTSPWGVSLKMVTTRSKTNNGTATGTPNGRSTATKRKSESDLAPTETKQSKVRENTDITRWRCLDEDGRLTWRYLEDDDAAEAWPQTYADKWYLGLDLVRSQLSSATN